MGERETVTEVRAGVTLQVAVPLALGSNVGRGVEDLLRPAEAVRHVAEVDELTVHLQRPLEDDVAASVRTALEPLDAVAAVERVDIHEAYPNEAY